MTNSNDNAGSALPQTKTQQTGPNKPTLYEQLTDLDQQLTNLLHSQHFYRQSLINLLDLDNDANCLIGALVVHQWLEASGESLLILLKEIRESATT